MAVQDEPMELIGNFFLSARKIFCWHEIDCLEQMYDFLTTARFIDFLFTQFKQCRINRKVWQIRFFKLWGKCGNITPIPQAVDSKKMIKFWNPMKIWRYCAIQAEIEWLGRKYYNIGVEGSIREQFPTLLTLHLVPLMCVSESGQHWFILWIIPYSAPNHFLNQCCVIVNWTLRNKLLWYFNQIPISHSRKRTWKYRPRNGGHFIHGRWVKG